MQNTEQEKSLGCVSWIWFLTWSLTLVGIIDLMTVGVGTIPLAILWLVLLGFYVWSNKFLGTTQKQVLKHCTIGLFIAIGLAVVSGGITLLPALFVWLVISVVYTIGKLTNWNGSREVK